MCAKEKMEAVKEEGTRAWGKQLNVLAQIGVDFLSHIYSVWKVTLEM